MATLRIKNFAAVALAFTAGVRVLAADYYVGGDNASDDNDGSTSAPFATITKAVVTARAAGDVIHVAPGTYLTHHDDGAADNNSKSGPNLCVKMVGEGATRDDVIIKSDGSHRTLRMASGAWVENLTLEGHPESKADRGGVIEMSGGTLTNCVVKNGMATSNGGNIYVSGGTIVDCVIRDGQIKSTGTAWDTSKGVNVMMNGAAKMSRCHMIGGTTTKKEDGTFYYERGSVQIGNNGAEVEDCLIEQCECGGLMLQASGSKVYNTTVVNNKAYGVWSWNAKQTFVNCVIFGNRNLKDTAANWAGNQPTDAAAKFFGCAVEGGTYTMNVEQYPYITITEEAFVDYANGDYRPSENGALVDAGRADPRGASASTLDLDLNPRISGTIDSGCYEFQKQDMVVRIESTTLSQAWAPATVAFAHAVTHSASPATLSFTYDFGDGSESVTTTAASIEHVYAKPGVYTVSIRASNSAVEESAEMVYEGHVRVASSVVYVKPGNASAAFPYNTPETAYDNLKSAINESLDGYTLLLEPGTYGNQDQVSVSKALTIKGTGNTPEAVVLRNTWELPDTYYHRTIELSNAGASLSNVTIENGRVKNHWGANLRVAGGAMVSNCVIRAGRTVADNGNAAGSAVVMGGANSILTHCIITNNVIEGSSNDQNYAGGTIFIEYGAKNAHLSNLLIAENRYVTSGDPKRGTAGIRFGGGNDYSTVENCTIVNNMVEGSCTGDSAGIYCTTWHGIIRNNIIVGNRETGKDKCTSVELDISGGSNYQYRNNITDDKLIEGSATKATDNLLVSDITAIFKDFAKGDYTLKTTSPACNKGTQTALSLKPVVDLAGNPRVFDIADKSRIDIGCYECQKKSGFVIAIR